MSSTWPTDSKQEDGSGKNAGATMNPPRKGESSNEAQFGGSHKALDDVECAAHSSQEQTQEEKLDEDNQLRVELDDDEEEEETDEEEYGVEIIHTVDQLERVLLEHISCQHSHGKGLPCHLFKGQNPASMSSVLSASAVELEKNIKADHLTKQLSKRVSQQDLVERNILPSTNHGGSHAEELPCEPASGSAHVLPAESLCTDRDKKIELMNHKLCSKRRASQNELVARNVLPNKVHTSGLLAAPKRDLERNIHSDHLSRGLTKRSSQQELVHRHVLNPNTHIVADRLAASAKSLDTKLKQDHLARDIKLRRDRSKLVQSHIVEKPTLSGILSAPARRLETSLHSDQLSHGLAKRESTQALQARHVLSKNRKQSVSNALLAHLDLLERQIKSDQVSNELQVRPTRPELVSRGVIMRES